MRTKILCGAVLLIPWPKAAAQDGLELVPDAAVAVVRVPAPAAAWRELAAAVGGVPPGLPAAVVGRIGLAVAAATAWLGGPVGPWLERVAGGGALLLALPAGAQPGWVLLVKPGDEQAGQALAQRLPQPWTSLPPGPWLAIASDAAALDLVRRQAAAGPGRWPALAAAPAAGRPAAPLEAVVDLAALRRSHRASAVDLGQLDAGALLFAGPLLAAFAAAPALRIEFRGGAELEVRAELAASPRGTPCAGLVPAAAPAAAALAAGAFGCLQIERGVQTLLRTPERFLAPSAALAVQGFLSIADAIDGAQTSFVDDLLGGLSDAFVLQAFVPGADREGSGDDSPMRLPELALVARLRDPGVEALLVRTLRTFATIVNAERAQRGQPPFLWREHRGDDGRGLCAEPPPWRGPGRPPPEYQLGPALWFARDHVAFGTTLPAARAALAAAAAGGPVHGDRLVLHGAGVQRVLAANQRLISLARQLDEGESEAAADDVVAVLAALAGAVGELALAVEFGEQTTTVALTLRRRDRAGER